jgi:HD-GYP domain-containing protein (c-di-GMP phosphodiesterase class II)
MKQDGLHYFLAVLGKLFLMRRIYPSGNRPVLRAAREAARRLAEWGKVVRITLLGDEAIVEDRRFATIPSSFKLLFQTLWESGCECIQIDTGVSEEDLIAWMEHVVSKKRVPYWSSRIMAGSLNLTQCANSRSARSPSVPVEAIAGYLTLLPQTQEALTDLGSRDPKGLVRGREIVCAIAGRLATGKELFEPIQEMKDFDDYTFTHALNVCVLSSALARALGFSEEWVKGISLAALCHDLGKKQVPKEILNKGGPLDPEERASIEKHPSYGAGLLIDTPGVESECPIMPVVAYEHHMGADHSGYPRVPAPLNCSGPHLASLLVAVADVYDALRTIRPYRKALSVARASTILIRDAMSGRFHKQYVSAFLQLVGVLAPGRQVILSDGSRGTVVEVRKDCALTPIVEGEDGQSYDLSNPSVLKLAEVEEEGAPLQEAPQGTP